MGRPQAKKKYVAPELREAKEFADQCGRTFYEAMWKGPRLISQRYMIESAAKFTGYDCSKDLEELDREIQQATKDLPVARENLQKARSQLAARKCSASNFTCNPHAPRRLS